MTDPSFFDALILIVTMIVSGCYVLQSSIRSLAAYKRKNYESFYRRLILPFVFTDLLKSSYILYGLSVTEVLAITQHIEPN